MAEGDLRLVLSGAAGQGLTAIETVLMRLLHRAGHRVFSYKEVMSRIRGGNNTTLIRVHPPEACFAADIDAVFPLAPGALDRLAERIRPDTLLIGEEGHLAGRRSGRAVALPFTDMAVQAGNKAFLNTVVSGCICGMLRLDLAALHGELASAFGDKGEAVVAGNRKAAELGFAAGAGHPLAELPAGDPAIAGQTLVDGAQAVGIGAIAGGCDFISAYPMSPGTGVLTYLAQQAAEFGIVVEQAEDEIAALNMALGAWYAGARALVTTSGGGFALMGEAISLAGCMESPTVIHLAQRPGPATGLPTRTEQGDLELALYSGHGEFPRILLAPGSHQEAIELACRAFDLADKHQSPVILLTDQYLIESTSAVERMAFPNPVRHLVETTADYRRYAAAGDGRSPRGLPGYGSGTVCCDSDEHDESGRITEDFAMRRQMVDKRLAKTAGILADAVASEYLGPEQASRVVVGWGSTRGVIRAALTRLDAPDTAQLHVRQVHPLPDATAEAIRRAERVVVVENNATGQFARHLAAYHGIRVQHSIRQYDGMPFAEENLALRLREALDG